MDKTDMDAVFMRRCLQLASLGRGHVSPNPMVGAVVVHRGQIIGEGYHRCYGQPHAEVNAINSVRDAGLLPECTLYVSLEPCSHYGKTPPCADLIVQKKIPRVVVGCLDPFPKVSGQGVVRLREAGIEVVTGILEEECKALNRTFMTCQIDERPFVTLKWAQSRDGYIDRLRKPGEPAIRISDDVSSVWVHRLRAEADAILVGTNTAVADNPSLTTRLWYGRSPLRIVLDEHARVYRWVAFARHYGEGYCLSGFTRFCRSYSPPFRERFNTRFVERTIPSTHTTSFGRGGSCIVTVIFRFGILGRNESRNRADVSGKWNCRAGRKGAAYAL